MCDLHSQSDGVDEDEPTHDRKLIYDEPVKRQTHERSSKQFKRTDQ
jgi:hypothetical protein